MTITITDASHYENSESYGRTRLSSRLKTDLDNDSVFRLNFGSSIKHQKKVSFFGGKILTAANGYDRNHSSKSTLTLLTLVPKCNCKHQPPIDSKSFFETITTPQQTENYRLQNIFAPIKDSFETKNWILFNTYQERPLLQTLKQIKTYIYLRCLMRSLYKAFEILT